MAVIAVVNLKGGVGKSNIAVNLACELASKGETILIDADAQGTAKYWADHGQLPVKCEHLPLESARDVGRWVQRVMGSKAAFVVIDAPPHIGAATEAAVGAADLVLLPCGASGADLVATNSALTLIRQARTSRDDHGPKCLMVPSKIDRRTSSGREIEEALKGFGEPIGPAIHQRAAFVDAFGAGQWIGHYAVSGAAHADIENLCRVVRRLIK